jgi:hypothetical protein
MRETQTLERYRLVNAVVSAAALCLGSNVPGTVVEDVAGLRYAVTRAVVDEVSAALSVPRDEVQRALEAALGQGLLAAPQDGPVAVRPVNGEAL